jgi:hypothetical protein
LRYVKYIMHIR